MSRRRPGTPSRASSPPRQLPRELVLLVVNASRSSMTLVDRPPSVGTEGYSPSPAIGVSTKYLRPMDACLTRLKFSRELPILTRARARACPRRMRPPSTASASLAVAFALLLVTVGPAHANIYYRAGTSTENVGGSTSISMTVPSGVVAGDLLMADVDAVGTSTITPPSGWNSIFVGAGFATYSTVHYRVANAADAAGASYSWNLGATPRKAVARMSSYVGVDATTI